MDSTLGFRVSGLFGFRFLGGVFSLASIFGPVSGFLKSSIAYSVKILKAFAGGKACKCLSIILHLRSLDWSLGFRVCRLDVGGDFRV